MTMHMLKTWPEFFEPVRTGEKKFELRLDDRAYRAGDTLVLQEWTKAGGYTGREIIAEASYLLCGMPWLREGYVCMSLDKLEFINCNPQA